jgi:hypothetical protein
MSIFVRGWLAMARTRPALQRQPRGLGRTGNGEFTVLRASSKSPVEMP